MSISLQEVTGSSLFDTQLMDTIQARSPYPGAGEWGDIIPPTLFPNNSTIRGSVKGAKGVVSTTEFRGEKYCHSAAELQSLSFKI